MKKKLIFFLLFILLVLPFTQAKVWDYLTRGLADTLYCRLTGCDMEGDIDMQGNIIRNATFINATIQTVQTLNVNGTLVAGSFNGSWNGSDQYVLKSGDTMSGDLIMDVDNDYEWSNGAFIRVRPNKDMIFRLGQ